MNTIIYFDYILSILNFSEEDTSERGKLYKPVSRLDEKRSISEVDVVRTLVQRPEPPGRPHAKKKGQDKKKSNLELFKEELRQWVL